jgi:protein-L-isoaspartate(D-aspartate) O-methyltransferase
MRKRDVIINQEAGKMKKYIFFAVIFLILAGMVFIYAYFARLTGFDRLCHDMVERQVKGRGITDEKILSAMMKVKRHWFVPKNLESDAYKDSTLFLGDDKYLAQPYMIALMLDALELNGSEKALEIGTKMGYQTALLAELCGSVYAVEIHKDITQTVRNRINELGYNNAFIKYGDGRIGWPEEGPFDVIIVNYAFDQIPETLLRQLNDNGRLILAIKTANPVIQRLVKVERTKDELKESTVTEGGFSIYPK